MRVDSRSLIMLLISLSRGTARFQRDQRGTGISLPGLLFSSGEKNPLSFGVGYSGYKRNVGDLRPRISLF
jgi:hypothetical protein